MQFLLNRKKYFLKRGCWAALQRHPGPHMGTSSAGRVRLGGRGCWGIPSREHSPGILGCAWRPSFSWICPRPGKQRTCLLLQCGETAAVLWNGVCCLPASKKPGALGRKQPASCGWETSIIFCPPSHLGPGSSDCLPSLLLPRALAMQSWPCFPPESPWYVKFDV